MERKTLTQSITHLSSFIICPTALEVASAGRPARGSPSSDVFSQRNPAVQWLTIVYEWQSS